MLKKFNTALQFHMEMQYTNDSLQQTCLPSDCFQTRNFDLHSYSYSYIKLIDGNARSDEIHINSEVLMFFQEFDQVLKRQFFHRSTKEMFLLQCFSLRSPNQWRCCNLIPQTGKHCRLKVMIIMLQCLAQLSVPFTFISMSRLSSFLRDCTAQEIFDTDAFKTRW